MGKILGLRARWWILLAIVLVPLILVGVLVWELMSSDLQARYLAKTAAKMTWKVQSGPSERLRFPQDGPYDQRLGYSKLPEYVERRPPACDRAGHFAGCLKTGGVSSSTALAMSSSTPEAKRVGRP